LCNIAHFSVTLSFLCPDTCIFFKDIFEGRVEKAEWKGGRRGTFTENLPWLFPKIKKKRNVSRSTASCFF
jgi:hypothetical protein